ncbi:hypothetical protein AA0Z99_07720 [Agrococcus sp. 1P02AA]|uniref:hypothetical protein n=1 Tax=Agrococcus sp. 1P02AA TaxID=3132259 RepID=UPI0039A6FF36
MGSQLPPPFDRRPFLVRDALRAGVGRGRLRGSDLAAPFRGVRAPPVGDLHALMRAYAPLMPLEHSFGGLTAARFWGLPIASAWAQDEPLVIARPKGATRGMTAGTRHIAYDGERLSVVEVDGLRVLEPLSAALVLAREHAHEAMVQVVDALLTPSRWYPGLRLPRERSRPFTTPERIVAFSAACRGLAGVAALRAAAADARVGVDSRFETITRLLIVEAGLPEPVVHPAVVIDGVASSPDLGYPELRIAIEYEGDGHRDAKQWHVDIERYARFEAAGWITVRVTRDHMARRGAHFVQRIRAALARRDRAR